MTQKGRLEAFADSLDDILELGHIQQGRFAQRNRNIEDFLNNKLIQHVDDVGDAAEIGKIARYSLEIKRIEDHLNDHGYTLRPGKTNSIPIREWWDLDELAARDPGIDRALRRYKTCLLYTSPSPRDS